MVVPYVLAHDLAMPLAALVWYFAARRDDASPLEISLFGLLWLLPFPLCFLVQAMGLPVTELVMTALYVALGVRALAPERLSHRPALLPAG
jgi:hypothetical protein